MILLSFNIPPEVAEDIGVLFFLALAILLQIILFVQVIRVMRRQKGK